jgi:hypothetical protein
MYRTVCEVITPVPEMEKLAVFENNPNAYEAAAVKYCTAQTYDDCMSLWDTIGQGEVKTYAIGGQDYSVVLLEINDVDDVGITAIFRLYPWDAMDEEDIQEPVHFENVLPVLKEGDVATGPDDTRFKLVEIATDSEQATFCLAESGCESPDICRGGAEAVQHCVDSDGDYPGGKGKTTLHALGIAEVVWDVCSDIDKLKEQICIGHWPYYKEYTCPEGCSLGACIGEIETEEGPVDCGTAGEICQYYGSECDEFYNNLPAAEKCFDDNLQTCDQAVLLYGNEEFLWRMTIVGEDGDECRIRSVVEYAQEADQLEGTDIDCSVPRENLDYRTFMTQYDAHPDYCEGTFYAAIEEIFTDAFAELAESFGEWAEEEQGCSDSDGGNDPEYRGTVYGYQDVYKDRMVEETDSCVTAMYSKTEVYESDYLMELSCYDDVISRTWVECELGCENGECW